MIAEGLLSAILEEPEDDLVRLAYADYIEDEGFPIRAALIRTQIELVNLDDQLKHTPMYLGACVALAKGISVSPEVLNPIHATLHKEHKNLAYKEINLFSNKEWVNWPDLIDFAKHLEMDLWDISYGYWEDPQNNTLKAAQLDWTWERGFPSTVSCPCHIWMAWGPAISNCFPIHTVELTDKNCLWVNHQGSWTQSERLVWVNPTESWRTGHTMERKIPTEIFQYLKKRKIGNIRSYRTVELAKKDLSQACLKYAKEFAYG